MVEGEVWYPTETDDANARLRSIVFLGVPVFVWLAGCLVRWLS